MKTSEAFLKFEIERFGKTGKFLSAAQLLFIAKCVTQLLVIKQVQKRRKRRNKKSERPKRPQGQSAEIKVRLGEGQGPPLYWQGTTLRELHVSLRWMIAICTDLKTFYTCLNLRSPILFRDWQDQELEGGVLPFLASWDFWWSIKCKIFNGASNYNHYTYVCLRYFWKLAKSLLQIDLLSI